MDYQKRLLKFLKDYDGVFTASEVASIWKRGANDVVLAAQQLKQQRKLSFGKDNVLSLR